MASFQPQPQQEVVTTSGPPQHVISNGNGSIKVVTVPRLPTAPVPVSMVTSVSAAPPQVAPPSMAASIVATHAHTDDKQKVILSSKLPNHVTLHHHNPQPPTSVVSLIKRSEAVEAAVPSGKTVVSSG